MTKKIIIAVLLTMPLMAVPAQDIPTGQVKTASPTTSRNLIKTSLVWVIAEQLNISYERMVSSEISIVLEVAVGGQGYVVSPQMRYYLSEDLIAPSGTFISPTLIIGNMVSGVGLTVGRQMVFKDKIGLEAYIGPAYYTEGVSIWGGLNVGIAF